MGLSRKRTLERRKSDGCTVVPIGFFLSSHVDLDTGGEFLRRLEWFLREWYEGRAVMARTGATYRPPTDRTPVGVDDAGPLQCPLGTVVDAAQKARGRLRLKREPERFFKLPT